MHTLPQIILQVGNIFTEVLGELTSSQKSGLEKKLSFRPEGYQFSPQYNRFIRDKDGQVVRRFWDGWKKQFWSNKKHTYFPTGLFSLASEFFKENNIQFKAHDLREKPQPLLQCSLTNTLEKRDYQDDAVSAACNTSRGILQMPTGSGKSATIVRIINELKVFPFLWLVTSIDLLEQAKKDTLEKFLLINGKTPKIGQIGGGVVDIQDITVCTIQSLVRALGQKWDAKLKFDDEDADDKTDIEKYKKEIIELMRSAKGVLADEIQHWRAETCQIVTRELKSAYYTFGTSATPKRDSGDDMLIQACFGKNIYKITASELIERGWLIKPEIKFVHIKDRQSKFKEWQSIYKDRVTECPTYNGIVANIANSFIDNGNLVLVLFKNIVHGKTLSSMIDGSKFLSGASTRNKRQECLNQLRNKEIRCITASVIYDEGIDIRALDTVILAGHGKSKVRAMQRVGRITRPYTDPVTGIKKTRATAVDFVIHDKYLLQHAKEREKMYRTEPLYDIEHIGL